MRLCSRGKRVAREICMLIYSARYISRTRARVCVARCFVHVLLKYLRFSFSLPFPLFPLPPSLSLSLSLCFPLPLILPLLLRIHPY